MILLDSSYTVSFSCLVVMDQGSGSTSFAHEQQCKIKISRDTSRFATYIFFVPTSSLSLTHLGAFIKPRSKPALAGYAQSLRATCHRDTKMFHFLESERLDTDTLGEHLSSSALSEATVLLQATGEASYLWFDKEHGSRNVELCTFLKSHSVNVKFVVCPTTKPARDAWKQHTPKTLCDFGEFLPETGNVDVWPDFNPYDTVDSQQICSLIRHVQTYPQREPIENHRKSQSEWPRMWHAVVTGVGGLLLLWFLRKQVVNLQEKVTGLQVKLDALNQVNLQGKVTELQLKLDALSQRSDPWSDFLSRFEAFVVLLPPVQPVQWILEKLESQGSSAWIRSMLWQNL